MYGLEDRPRTGRGFPLPHNAAQGELRYAYRTRKQKNRLTIKSMAGASAVVQASKPGADIFGTS